MTDPFIDTIIETIIDEAIEEMCKKKAHKILFNYKICSYIFSRMASSNKYMELANMLL